MDDKDHDARHDLVESLLWDVATRVLVLGVDVILDFGFWGRSERNDFRSRAVGLGVGFKIHFLDVSEEVLLERLAGRNANLPPGTFRLSKTDLKAYMLLFEPPAQEELET
jgi:predicted kinase